MAEDLNRLFPIALADYDLAARRPGLVVVDEVKGFCAPGCGPLAPPGQDAMVDRMVAETDALARRFAERGRPILAFQDTHTPGVPEPPYPPHCEAGSGQEELIDELAWLEDYEHALLLRKDCINGYVGAIHPTTGRNAVRDWVNRRRLDTIVVTGICTDVCVMDFVLTMLSVRNHGLTPSLTDIVVLEPACATYDLPREAAEALGLPETAVHPQKEAHHMGLYMMATRGAVLAGSLTNA